MIAGATTYNRYVESIVAIMVMMASIITIITRCTHDTAAASDHNNDENDQRHNVEHNCKGSVYKVQVIRVLEDDSYCKYLIQ